jgi:ABC-type multidrug transport system fused ATPase/permease subunit
LGGLAGLVTENGSNLSGGQKQRLALARLILKNPDILVLDEATSALDNQNENIIQQNLEAIFKNKTTITIAHRLTTLKNCDRILVFDQGTIAESGTYDALAENKNSLFYKFLHQTRT